MSTLTELMFQKKICTDLLCTRAELVNTFFYVISLDFGMKSVKCVYKVQSMFVKFSAKQDDNLGRVLDCHCLRLPGGCLPRILSSEKLKQQHCQRGSRGQYPRDLWWSP